MFLSKKRKSKFLKALKFTKLPGLPFILNIEPGNICNLKCPLCPTGLADTAMSRGVMQLALFKDIFYQLKDALTSVNLFSWGEPLLNKDLVSFIRCIKQGNKSIRVITSTNLNIHNEKILEELINSGIDEIIVSCDGASRETYEKYRVGGDFNLVMQNLGFLARKKKELGKNVSIVWNFIVFKHNENEVGEARKAAELIGVNFRVGLMRTSMKEEILKPHRETIHKYSDWIPDNPQFSAYDKARCTPKKIIKTCRKPWQEISINWDGKVFPCCAIYGDNFNLGDASKDSIISIWNNEQYVRARKEIIGGKEKPLTICGICRSNGFMHM